MYNECTESQHKCWVGSPQDAPARFPDGRSASCHSTKRQKPCHPCPACRYTPLSSPPQYPVSKASARLRLHSGYCATKRPANDGGCCARRFQLMQHVMPVEFKWRRQDLQSFRRSPNNKGRMLCKPSCGMCTTEAGSAFQLPHASPCNTTYTKTTHPHHVPQHQLQCCC